MAIESIRVKSRAKLNLTFQIKGLLPDGYHEVETVLQSIDLEDELCLRSFQDKKANIEISAYDAMVPGDFPLDRKNLIVRAIEKYRQRVAEVEDRSFKIEVKKSIPIGAGLAGGSADAAAALYCINKLMANRLNPEELLELASHLGADVPFALKGGTCIGRHRGDRLEPVASTLPLVFIVVKPRFLSISTPALFKQYDLAGAKVSSSSFDCKSTASQSLVEALESGNLEQLCQNLENDFEKVLFELHPELLVLKERLLELGCLTANLTGSGPSIYGLLANWQQGRFIMRMLIADSGRNEFKNAPYYKHGRLDIFLAQSRSEGIKVIETTS